MWTMRKSAKLVVREASEGVVTAASCISSRSPVLHYEEGAAAMAEHPAQYCVVRESGAKGERKGKRCGGDEAGGREFAEGRGEIT